MTHEQWIEAQIDAEAVRRVSIDICATCVAADANGTDDLGDDQWLGFFPFWTEERWLWSDVNCGGDDVDDLRCEGHFVRPGTPCDGCGDTLGGERYCYVAVRLAP